MDARERRAVEILLEAAERLYAPLVGVERGKESEDDEAPTLGELQQRAETLKRKAQALKKLLDRS